MKTKKIYSVMLLLCLFPPVLFANWSSTKGYFNFKKDIEKDLSDYSHASAAVYYRGQIFHFVNYHWGDKIIIRTLKTQVDNFKDGWTITKDDDVENLNGGFYDSEWQPAPVVFNENLYLFVSRSDGTVGYSAYDTVAKTWSAVKPGPAGCDGEYMAAVTVLDKICLIARNKTTYRASIYWTTDLVNWSHYETSMNCANFQYYQDIYYYYHISALAKSYIDGSGNLNTKIMVSYIPPDQSVRVGEFAFDASGGMSQICDQLVSNEFRYASATLAEGSVKGDPSSGICTQVFLKKADKDNLYCRYRILRYQKIEQQGSSWTQQESNMLKQNYGWAASVMDLNALIYPFMVLHKNPDNSETTVIRQYMCVVYRSYDDVDHPLNCAFALTDSLVYMGQERHVMSDPSQFQYLGYIEGPPPFALNPPCEDVTSNPYVNCEDQSISTAEYANSVSNQDQTELAFDLTRSVKVKIAGFTAGFSYMSGKKNSRDEKITETYGVGIVAEEGNNLGYYLCLKLVLFRDQYNVYDVHNKFLYSVYSFYMDEDWHTETPPLGRGLVPGDLNTYMDDSTINWLNYNKLDKNSLSWSHYGEAHSSVSIDQSTTYTNTKSGTLELGLDLGEFLELGVEGGLDYSVSSTTTVSNEYTCYTRMNAPKAPTDVEQVDYEIYWLTPTSGLWNWWLYDESQPTWCLTYLVTSYTLLNGQVIGGDKYGYSGTGDDNGKGSRLLHLCNRPNPFAAMTTIEYTIGTDALAGISDREQMTTLAVYNSAGIQVAELVHEDKAPGTYEVTWDASRLTAGLYFCRLQTGSQSTVSKLVLSK